jgi:crossover junction endodeoxyribonuclease RusA
MRRLVIPGRPVSKGRPRCTSWWEEGKQKYVTHLQTPHKTVSQEQVIGYAWKELHGGDLMEGPVRVYLTFVEGPRQRPQDIDNLVKLVLDALNGVAWEDDQQVMAVHAELFRGRPEPMTRIIVEEVNDV